MKNTLTRFIDCHVPTEVCNFKCPYCYISQHSRREGEIGKINHSPEEIRQALSLERLGGVCLINFCAGGETLLGEEILPIIKEILREGHFVQIVTNGSISKRFEEICTWEKECLERLFIKYSFHYTELLRLNMLEEFFCNIIMVKNAGVSISLEITPGDDMLPYIDDMKKISMEKLGAMPHVTVARNENTAGFEVLTSLNMEEYKKVWGSFESDLFSEKIRLLSEKRTEFCYAGEWTLFLDLKSGDLKQCYRGKIIDNIYKDVPGPLHFKPIGHDCPEQYCYNGHAWLTLGAIPELNMKTYADVRNRDCYEGTSWLTDTVKNFFEQKLETCNIKYNEKSKLPKVLLLGDSICEGYRSFVQHDLCEEAEIIYPDGNARFSTYLLRYVREWAEQIGVGSDVAIVHFNVGLWDILRLEGDEPLVGIELYENNLKRIIKKFRKVFPKWENGA